ncbi:glycosyltransferase [Patescibacteria group bacterium]|nr:glycosyltransferase [Patescibacteria group bacterium]
MKKPKIAIAHEFLSILGGAEKVLIQIHRTFPEAPIFCLLSNQKFTQKYLPKGTIHSSRINHLPDFLTNKHQLFLMQFPIAVEQFDFSEFDIVISSSNSFMKGIITKPSTVHICYNHSPTRYIWDQTADWIEQKNLGIFRPIINWRFNKLRQWDFLAADRVDQFIANSQYVAKRIQKYYRRDVDHVLFPSIDTKEFKPTQIDKQDYYLILSRLENFKRFDLAVEAFNQLKLPLYIAGTGSAESHLKSIAQENIKFLGFVSDEKKIELMQHAKAFIFPGEEDFGIVPIESLAAGTPVIAYGVGGLLESIEPGKTGLFFDNQTVDDIREAVTKFTKNYKQFDPKYCIKSAAKFDHQHFSKKLQSIVNNSYQNSDKILFDSVRK